MNKRDTVPIVNIEKPLREKVGEEATKPLVNVINDAQIEQKNGILEFVEEKFERRLSEEISGLRVELSGKIAETRIELTNQIASKKAELIKWMLIFWIGQVAMILGILFAFFKR